MTIHHPIPDPRPGQTCACGWSGAYIGRHLRAASKRGESVTWITLPKETSR